MEPHATMQSLSPRGQNRNIIKYLTSFCNKATRLRVCLNYCAPLHANCHN